MKSALTLYAYQQKWLADQSRFKVGMFARQTGKTFTTTLEIVLDCLNAESQDKRTRWAILSRGERQAKEAMNDIRDSDKCIVESTFNQLINLICELNFSDVISPTFELYEEEIGDKNLAARDQALTMCSVQFSAAYWKRAYNLADDDIIDIKTGTSTASSTVSNFGETTATNDAGLVIDTLSPDAGTLNEQSKTLTSALITSLKQNSTPENILDHLISTYPDMDEKALQNELARLLFLSDLTGHLEAIEELAK